MHGNNPSLQQERSESTSIWGGKERMGIQLISKIARILFYLWKTKFMLFQHIFWYNALVFSRWRDFSSRLHDSGQIFRPDIHFHVRESHLLTQIFDHLTMQISIHYSSISNIVL